MTPAALNDSRAEVLKNHADVGWEIFQKKEMFHIIIFPGPQNYGVKQY
jgi:hypothetical protein